MPSVPEILEIAVCYAKAMADAMVAACVAWFVETGTPLPKIPARPPRPGGAAALSADRCDGVDFERMVRTNSDTRWQHV